MMSKFKVSYKNSQITVKTKLGKSEKVNIIEMQIFQSKLIRGLMRPVVEGERKITYHAPIGVPLGKFLKEGVSKNDFFLILAQISEVIKKIENHNLNINNLITDMQYVFINELTKELQFVYQPILGQVSTVNIFEFLYGIIYGAVFRAGEDTAAVREFHGNLQLLQHFSTAELENIILKVYPEVYKQVKRQQTGQSQTLHSKQWGNTETGTQTEDAEEQTTLLGENEEETALLSGEDEEATALLQPEMLCKAYLVRSKNQERIEVDKPAFRVGKERSYVDYFIANNGAVSRIHADIITKGEDFFIKDNHSTNGTFVNDMRIPVHTEIQIYEGDRIVLANESFQFHVEKADA